MNALIDKFLQYMRLELNRSTHTIAAYRNDLDGFSRFLRQSAGAEAIDVAAITGDDLRAWLINLSDEGDGSRTLRRKVQAVRAFYKWLQRKSIVSANPARDIELARVPKRLPSIVRTGVMDELLDKRDIDMSDMEAVRDRLIVMMLYETGMRRAELITLRDTGVDTAAKTLKVRGKRDKERIIPFGDELAEAIEQYRRLRPAPAEDTFFTRDNGEPLYPTLVYRVVKRQLQEAGVTGKKSPHVLRHTFATTMLDNGAGINSVKELLGHASLAATQVYTHVTFSELKHNYELAHPRALKD